MTPLRLDLLDDADVLAATRGIVSALLFAIPAWAAIIAIVAWAWPELVASL